MRANTVDDFWSRVVKTDGCWLWIGFTHPTGYGIFGIGRRWYRAHRYSWELVNGPIPDGLFACHKCDVRNCVNPDHLFLGTNAENIEDSVRKGRHVSTDNLKNAKPLKGEANGRARLTEALVRQIRERHAAGAGRKALAADFGVPLPTLNNVVDRKSWKHVS